MSVVERPSIELCNKHMGRRSWLPTSETTLTINAVPAAGAFSKQITADLGLDVSSKSIEAILLRFCVRHMVGNES